VERGSKALVGRPYSSAANRLAVIAVLERFDRSDVTFGRLSLSNGQMALARSGALLG
jgi:hypothetical protein